MSVLENFKNIPRSPYGGRQGSNVIFFFFKFATKSLEEKKRGGDDRPLSPTPGATDQWAQPTGARGAGRPSRERQGGPVPPGDRVSPPYIRPPLIPSSFDLKKSTKNPEKIEG